MTTAHHLRLIDGMCGGEFPSRRTPSVAGVSGPGFHTAYLRPYGGAGDDDDPTGAEHRARCLAEHDALLTLLTSRWGEPQVMSPWSARERMLAGEDIPEPWADLVAGCEFLRLWRIGERWIAIGLFVEADGPACELTVVATDVDPP
ncbi:hypothetical protein ACIP6P_28730 [Streptomyces sp. NPDC088729]|uniref:hypothetical protein n=1 Tax=Streptomyces sp. NPDC088729 TaxID=3365876 RepID=UPI003810BE15